MYTHTHNIYIYIYSKILFAGGEWDNPPTSENLPKSPIKIKPPSPHNLVQKFEENLPPSLEKLVLSYRKLFIGNILTLVWKGHLADINSIDL